MNKSLRMPSARLGAIALILLMASLPLFAQPAPPPGGPDFSGGQIQPRDAQRPPAPGEAPGGGRPNADPMEMLINSAELQAELKIEPDQLSHLKSIAHEFRSRQFELLQQLQAGPEKARAARAALDAHMEMGRAMIARVLKRRQLDRLQQIMMQVGGACLALRDENVSQALSIDPSQMRRIMAACQKMQQAGAPIPAGVGPREACAAMRQAKEAYDAVRGQVEAEMATILSGGQTAALHAMEGEPFAMTPPAPPGCQGENAK